MKKYYLSFIFDYENEQIKMKEIKKDIADKFPQANITEIKIEKVDHSMFNVESEVTVIFTI